MKISLPRFFGFSALVTSALLLSACAHTAYYTSPKGMPDQLARVSIKTVDSVSDGANQLLNPLAPFVDAAFTQIDGVTASPGTREIKLLPGQHTLETTCSKKSLMDMQWGNTTLTVNAKPGYQYLIHVYPQGKIDFKQTKTCYTKIDQVSPINK